MNFERLTNSNHPDYISATELYATSFPPHEQREPRSQSEILNDSAYHFTLIYDEGKFVGLLLYWETKDYLYVEHFCIVERMRNRGYGQKALHLLTEQGKKVILEIDPPVDDIAKRRKGFYERCGFVENLFAHVHPPYHRNNHGHTLVLMSYPEKLTENECKSFHDFLKLHIMNNVF